MRRLLSIFAFAALAASAHAQDLPSDLKQVPGNALGFVHIRTHDLWNSPIFTPYREALKNAGADAAKLIEERISPDPASIDRATVIMLPAGGGAVETAVILHFTKKVDAKKAVAGFVKQSAEGPDGKEIAYYAHRDIALQILDDNTVLFGTHDSPLALSNRPKVNSFASALKEAAEGKRTILAVGNPRVLPPQAFAGLPANLRPLAAASHVQIGVNLGKHSSVEVSLAYADKQAAVEAEQSIDDLRTMGKAMLTKIKAEAEMKLAKAPAASLFDLEKSIETLGPVFALGSAKQYSDMIDSLPIQRKDTAISLKMPIPEELQSVALVGVPVMVALLVPAVQKVREAASRSQDMNNLKQIGLAMHGYHDTYKMFPPPAINKDGKALLSWRVAILPYIEEGQLYQDFKLNEPWDSEHNKKLIPRMPKIYMIPHEKTKEGMTHYQVFVGGKGGPSALFTDAFDKVRIASITDGSSNTFMVAEGETPVVWTKPDDLAFDPKAAPPRLFRHPSGGTNILFCDGSVRYLAPTVPAETIKACITRANGEVFFLD